MVLRLIALLLLTAAPLFAREAKEDARIDGLLGRIVALEGAKFIRNGKAHEAREAADHLRKKLKRAGERVKTAEDFIDGLATKSSFSGKAYRIRFKDGSETATGPWLHGQLKEIDAGE